MKEESGLRRNQFYKLEEGKVRTTRFIRVTDFSYNCLEEAVKNQHIRSKDEVVRGEEQRVTVTRVKINCVAGCRLERNRQNDPGKEAAACCERIRAGARNT